MAPCELFPLPCLAAGEHLSRRMGRRTCQRVQRRIAVRSQANRTIDAWNWMAGHDKAAELVTPSAAQCGALVRAEALASEVPPPVESQKAASRRCFVPRPGMTRPAELAMSQSTSKGL